MEEAEVDHLYSLPLDQFTAARDALAARMKTAGDAAEAARIKALRKPTVPAWVINQLARRYPKQVETLIATSDRLRRAQKDLLEGAPAGDLWEATLAERSAVGELVKAGEWILTEGGLGAGRAILDRVADTLYAAATDPSGRTLLRRGLITQEMRRAGFGDLMSAPPPAPAATSRVKHPSKPEPRPHKGKAGAGPSARQILEAERAAQRALRDAERAEADAVQLEREARRSDADAVQARKRADAAAHAAAGAKAEAASARRRADASRKAADREKATLAKLRGRRA